ncbi:PAS domain S-box protein [Candidatus Poribacteria bacterium]|nr:PAS domain S-box protein [Candidatus Poribacteria bacterium]
MNEKIYKNIIDSLPYAFLVLDKNFRIIKCNRICQTLFSRPQEEIEGKDLSEIIPHKELRTQADLVLKGSNTKLVELNLETENPKILRATVTSLNNLEKNENALCLITLEDISERARLESQLLQSEKLAGMGLLASTIAHELGNPLSIMNSTLQYIQKVLMDSEKDNSEIITPFETIMDSIRQMHDLLRILSGFTGSQRPRFEFTDLRPVLSQMLTFIHKEAEIHNISVSYQFVENMPECEIDVREIKQLLLNLLKNAIEAMPQGGLLNVKTYLNEGKDSMFIEISDTGQGLTESELRSIFRPFYSTKPSGTGLGLPFCRRVVEEHGGEINVESKPGKGSVFTIILPISQEEDI